MTVQLTPQQKRAVEVMDKNLCVVAGAGSGKTRVLVERFYRLVVEGGIPVNRILAITFTEKATNEIKTRIAKRFEKSGRSDLRREVASAYISTIHGFCARLLRENAIEAHVDPEFSVIQELEAAALQEEILTELVNEWIQTQPHKIHTIIEDVKFEAELSALDKRFFRNVLDVYSNIRTSGKTIDEAFTGANVKIEDFKDNILQAYSGLELSVKEVAELPHVSRQKYETVMRFKGKIEKLDGSLLTRDILVELKGFLKNLGRNVTEVLKEPFANLKDAMSGLVSACVEILSFRVRGQLAELFNEFHERYKAAKRDRSFLDFDDLQIEATALMENVPGIRDAMQGWFEYILVDEFQDTSFVQNALIKQLAQLGRLFVVGDAKQSIYTWRDADPEVFNSFQEEMKKQADSAEIVRLNKNFRSRPEILGFVNYIFASLWGNPEDAILELEPLEAGLDFTPKEAPSVELHIVDAESKAIGREAEANFLAGKIKNLVENGEVQITERSADRCGSPVAYGDIVLLLRSTSDIKTYEHAFNNADIPYYVVVGRGFYNAREIVDLTNFLKLLSNPLDEVVLASVLKSPFVAINDEALFILAQARITTGQNLYELLKDGNLPSALSSTTQDKLNQFMDVLMELGKLVGISTIEALVNKLFKLTDFDLAVLAQANGKMRYANLRRILQMARQFDSSGIFGLTDFVRMIEEYRFKQIRQSEAPVESEEDDAVRIMTIHQAKGLEFPVVIIPDISRKAHTSGSDIIFSRNGGVAFKYNIDDDDSNKNYPSLKKPLSYIAVQEENDAKEKGEFLRLLYVAATRAMEHLILSGTLSPHGQSSKLQYSGWLGELKDILGLEGYADGDKDVIDCDGVAVKFTLFSSEKVAGGESTWTKLLRRYEKNMMRGEHIAGELDEESVSDANEIVKRINRKLVPANYEKRIYTVTEIMNFIRCPQSYFLRNICGIATLGSIIDNDGMDADDERYFDEDSRNKRVNLGTAFHNVMKRVNFNTDENELEKIIADELAVTPIVREDTYCLIQKWVKSFHHNEMAKRIVHARSVKKEYSFIYAYNGQPIRGVIDLFACDEERQVLVDYKTNRVNLAQIDDLIEKYKIQMYLYKKAVEAITGREVGKVYLYLAHCDRLKEKNFKPQEAGEIEASVDAFFRDIRAHSFPQKMGSWCEVCDVKTICKEVDHDV